MNDEKILIAYGDDQQMSLHFKKENVDRRFMLAVCAGIVSYLHSKGIVDRNEAIKEITYCLERVDINDR